jgi:hypothetical protein
MKSTRQLASLIGATGILLLVPGHRSFASAGEVTIELDKGTLILSVAEQTEGATHTNKPHPNCRSELRLRQSGNRYVFKHVHPDACPSGQVVQVSVKAGYSIRVSHGGGIVIIKNTDQLKGNFSALHFRTEGGIIQGRTKGFNLQGIGVPTDAAFENSSADGGSTFSVNLLGGVIELR